VGAGGGTERGSLFWLLNHTKTAFGGRLLRNWVTQPLLLVNEINERLEAVEELAGAEDTSVNNKGLPCVTIIQDLFHAGGIPDLERTLRRVYHRRCTPSEFLKLMGAFQNLSKSLGCWKLPGSKKPKSKLLCKLLQGLPNLDPDLAHFLSSLSHQAAEQNDKTNLFVEGRFAEIDKYKRVSCLI
jgi:DNA mismatch repair protein MSH3